jgi:hypothetical protein
MYLLRFRNEKVIQQLLITEVSGVVELLLQGYDVACISYEKGQV